MWGEKELSCTAGQNISQYNHYGKQFEMPYNAAMPLLGKYTKEHE
jgi:hypothetical protein